MHGLLLPMHDSARAGANCVLVRPGSRVRSLSLASRRGRRTGVEPWCSCCLGYVCSGILYNLGKDLEDLFNVSGCEEMCRDRGVALIILV